MAGQGQMASTAQPANGQALGQATDGGDRFRKGNKASTGLPSEAVPESADSRIEKQGGRRSGAHLQVDIAGQRRQQLEQAGHQPQIAAGGQGREGPVGAQYDCVWGRLGDCRAGRPALCIEYQLLMAHQHKAAGT